MVGFISAPLDNVAEAAEGEENIPSPVSDATAGFFSLTSQLARSTGNTQAEFGAVDDFGRPITAPEPAISPDDLNAKYAIKPQSGFKGLHFDTPLPESVAQDMNAAKQAELQRNDAANRLPAGIGTSLARTGLEFAQFATDPLNVASMFLPGIGEANMARMLGTEGVEGLGLAATRFATGAASGVIQQAPVVGLHYLLGQQEQEDYGALQAMGDLAMGGLFGGALHASIGAAGDWLGERWGNTAQKGIVDNDPLTRDAALRAGVAAVAEDRPVDVADLIDLGGAEADRIDHLNSLRDEAAGLREDIRRVPGPAEDPITAERIDAIEQELTDPDQTLSQNRRAELMQEHDMLTQGSAPTDEDILNEARSGAQRQGLQTALDRTNQRIADLQEKIRTSEATRRAQGAPDPEVKAVSDAADAAVKTAESKPSALPPEVKPDEMASLESQVKYMRDNGMMDAAAEREYDALSEQAKNDPGTAEALKAASQCLLASM